jgi:hypothetical protein
VAIADVWEKELDSPTAPRRRWRRCCRWRRRTSAALLSLARLHEAAERWDEAARRSSKAAANASAPAEIAEIQFRNAQILIRKEADRPRSSARLLRALDADPTHRPTLAALEKMARDAKDDERLVQLLELALETTTDDEERSACSRRSRRCTRGRWARRRRRCRTWSGWCCWIRRDRRPRAAGRRAGRVGTHRRRGRIMAELVAELTKARRGKDAARWHTRLGMLSEGARRSEGRGGQLRRRVQAGSQPPGDGGGAWAARVPRGRSREARASTTGRCCCRTSTRRPRASRRPRST